MNRIFSLGSEWIYFKIYSGYKIADVILLEYLKEKIEKLSSEKYIKKWFFIRYNDPDSHIRIRFQVENSEAVFHVIKKLNLVFEELIHKNYIWKVQSDTYLREVERYGEQTMVASETLFHHDSKMVLDYLNLNACFENERTQLLFSFMAIDSFLNAFKLTKLEKLALLNEMQQGFKQEFNATKILKTQLDKHYRLLENDISDFINQNSLEELLPLYKIIEEKFDNIKPIAESIIESLEINLNSFLLSHIHMMINRQFTSRQREYETVIYDHLFRYYKTCCYRKSAVTEVSFQIENV